MTTEEQQPDENADQPAQGTSSENSETAQDGRTQDGESQDDPGDATQSTDDDFDPKDRSDPDTFVDRSKIDFDPDDGLLSGTAIQGGTSIPGPHESVDDVAPEGEEGADFDESQPDDSGDDTADDADGKEDD